MTDQQKSQRATASDCGFVKRFLHYRAIPSLRRHHLIRKQRDAMHFHDMKIQVHYHKGVLAKIILQKQGYQGDELFGIQVTESRRGEMAQPEIVPYTQERKNVLEPLLKRLEKERKKMSLDEVAQLGKMLAHLLFYGTVHDLLVRCRDYADDRGEGLRLRLVLDDAQSSRLPWEYVYQQQVAGGKATWSGFLALDPNISIVRHEPMLITSRSVTTQRRPLKVFVGFAEPEGIGEDLDEEALRLNIKEALKEQIEAGHIHLTVDEHLEAKNLDKVAGYGIFNFSGHGAYLTEDELAYYREKYRVKQDDQTETKEAPPSKKTKRKKAALRQAHRATLRAGFARRQQNEPPVEEQTEAATEEHALRRADRDTLRAGVKRREKKSKRKTALRKADRATLMSGFAERRKRLSRAKEQPRIGAKAESSQGILIFEKDGGYPHFYRADNLAQRLKRSGVSVVVMDACYSAKTSNKYDKWSGMVSALVRVGIPAVLGMQYAFSDPAAQAFWPDFYEAVAAGLPLDQAVSAGRLAIMDLEPEPSEKNPKEMLTAQNDFGFPALYMRSEDGLLFPELTNDESLAEHREHLSRQSGFLPLRLGKTGPVGPGPDARLSGVVPPELALLNHLASKSPGGDFVYVYYASKSSTAPTSPPAKPAGSSHS